MIYRRPETIPEALEYLKKDGGRIIAGGTDLVLDLNEGKIQVSSLIDVSQIEEMKKIQETDKHIMIGSAVTHRELHDSYIVRHYASALGVGSGHVGSLQIRNVATVGGNVVNAQPAADAAVPIAVMNPEFVVRGIDGVRYLGMNEMYAGFGKSGIDSTREILTGIRIDKEDMNEGSGYERLELRKALALPMLCAAARVRLRGNVIEWGRIAMGPVGVGPVRAISAEKWLSGKEVSETVLEKAGELALTEANPRSNLLRGSREYRMDTLPVIVKRALKKAITNAAEKNKN